MKLRNWDPQAAASEAYWQGDKAATLIIRSVLGTTAVPAEIYFRTLEEMPMAELYALHLAKGQVLEIGAGNGSHALALQEMDIAVTALDIHPALCRIMQERGVLDIQPCNFWTYHTAAPYDTLLMMMNGIGFVGTESRMPEFFIQCDALLAKGGQILLDSTDLSINVPGIEERNAAPAYWGEMQYTLGYQEQWGEPFWWLYLDPDRLRQHSMAAGWHTQVVYEGNDGHYLARLTRM